MTGYEIGQSNSQNNIPIYNIGPEPEHKEVSDDKIGFVNLEITAVLILIIVLVMMYSIAKFFRKRIHATEQIRLRNQNDE